MEYDKIAADSGWTATEGMTIMGLPCSVWQRGNEVLVHWPHVHGSALYCGRVIAVEQISDYLTREPRAQTLTYVITGDKAGLIAALAAMQAERVIQAAKTDLKREQNRLRSEASGIELAIHALQSWQEVPA